MLRSSVMTQATVLLFDIDGTLLSSGGVGYRAMLAAFAKLHMREDVFQGGFSFAGMTDRAIIRHGLGGVPSAAIDEVTIDRLLDAYLEHLEIELARSKHFKVLPGVFPLLESVHALPGVAVGLGTGNVRRGAFAKLARGALDGAFAFGGYGCDAEDRTELLRVGATRGAEALGATLAECRVVVIGDTPKDVAAAHGIGARCIGVATGSFTAADLRACGADVAFETLEAEGVRAALFEGTGAASPSA